MGGPALLLWADEWKACKGIGPQSNPALNPFSLDSKKLKNWLNKINLLPEKTINTNLEKLLHPLKIKKKDSCNEENYSEMQQH